MARSKWEACGVTSSLISSQNPTNKFNKKWQAMHSRFITALNDY